MVMNDNSHSDFGIMNWFCFFSFDWCRQNSMSREYYASKLRRLSHWRRVFWSVAYLNISFELYVSLNYENRRDFLGLDWNPDDSFSPWQLHSIIDRLIQSLTDWFTHWQIDLIIDSLIQSLTPWFSQYQIDSIIDRLIHTLTDWFNQWQLDPVIDSLIQSLTAWFSQWQLVFIIHRCFTNVAAIRTGLPTYDDSSRLQQDLCFIEQLPSPW